MAKQFLNPASLGDIDGPFSHGVRAGNTIWVSAQSGTDAQGRVVGGSDALAQCRALFERIREVLAAGGAARGRSGGQRQRAERAFERAHRVRLQPVALADGLALLSKAQHAGDRLGRRAGDERVRRVQAGSLHVYLGYLLATLVALLLWGR